MWWYICWRRVKLVYFNICHLLHTNYTSIKLLKISFPFPDTMLPVTGVLFPCQRSHHAWVHSNNCLSLRVSKDVLVWESICVTSTTEVNHAGLLEFCYTWDRKGGAVRIVSGPWMQQVISTDSPWNALQKKRSGSWSSSSWHHGFSSQCSKFLYQLSALGFISKSLACSRAIRSGQISVSVMEQRWGEADQIYPDSTVISMPETPGCRAGVALASLTVEQFVPLHKEIH